MRQLQHLYLIESRLREAKAGPQLRQAVRAHQSSPIVNRLERVVSGAPSLSITHISFRQKESEVNIGEPGDSPPHNGIAGRWI